jgi:serine/threonine protein phosphatase 1
MPDLSTEVHAVLGRPRRVWAIASVHGEAQRLARLHDAMAERIRLGDRFVYLGNLIGHGPDATGTLDEALDFRRRVLTLPGAEPWDIVYLRGAQEEMWQKLLQLQFAPNPLEVLEWMLAKGVGATLSGYGGSAEEARWRMREGSLAIARWNGELRRRVQAHPGHEELFTGLRRYAVSEDGGLLLVNAGIDPARPLSEQRDTFWWGDAYLDAATPACGGFRRLVRGYQRGKGREIGDFVASIDGGCGFGGPLHAGCFDAAGDLADWLDA